MKIIVGDGFDAIPQSRVARPRVGMICLLAIAICSMLCMGGLQLANAHKQQLVAADTPQPHISAVTKPTASAVSTTAPSSTPAPGAATQSTTPVQTCVPYTDSLVPTQIDLRSVSDGLAQLIDSPTQYRIYGTNAATLRSQVRQCAPATNGSAQYTAQTTYSLNWQYGYTRDASGMCRVVHPKVGLHVSQILPVWQPTAQADAGLPATWQQFMSALATHENGHTALDVQYAQTLQSDLNNFPATACDHIQQAVQHLADSDVATLNQANDNYDSSTNHGATQGAILP